MFSPHHTDMKNQGSTVMGRIGSDVIFVALILVVVYSLSSVSNSLKIITRLVSEMLLRMMAFKKNIFDIVAMGVLSVALENGDT
ncbi:hypothetical protein PF005_g441 [Phytophthora fragariae]|uniref:Uncharacterized protein n=2 Tax=Phytophthora fragariae TaxID=53985 RepID=A0A6A3ZK91_9STRA|nr:hypothetical protein PF005_g441 [Phytophthora fragariae]KAE9258116.1 hypothetical protein PF002_g413 [Phytophthora fragariae]